MLGELQNRAFERGMRLRIWRIGNNRLGSHDKPLKVVRRKITQRMWHLRETGLGIGQHDKVERMKLGH